MTSMAQWAHDCEQGGAIVWSPGEGIQVQLGDPIADRWDAEAKVSTMAEAERWIADAMRTICPHCTEPGPPPVNTEASIIDRLLTQRRGGKIWWYYDMAWGVWLDEDGPIPFASKKTPWPGSWRELRNGSKNANTHTLNRSDEPKPYAAHFE